MNPLISICIPTYNREVFLNELLDIILMQGAFSNKDFEIIISDNCSTDGTESLVLSFQKKFDNLKFFKNAENIGADRNVLSVIQKSTGRYIWCLSDDDIIMPNGLNRVVSIIKDNIENSIGFIQTNFCGLNVDLSIYKTSFIGEGLKTIVFDNVHELYGTYGYFHFGLTFISTHIFSSEILKLELHKIPLTYIPHTCIAGLISKKKALFINEDIVGYRPHNASIDMKNFKTFFEVFVIGHFKYMLFLWKNDSIISQGRLFIILSKMFLYSFLILAKSIHEKK